MQLAQMSQRLHAQSLDLVALKADFAAQLRTTSLDYASLLSSYNDALAQADVLRAQISDQARKLVTERDLHDLAGGSAAAGVATGGARVALSAEPPVFDSPSITGRVGGRTWRTWSDATPRRLHVSCRQPYASTSACFTEGGGGEDGSSSSVMPQELSDPAPTVTQMAMRHKQTIHNDAASEAAGSVAAAPPLSALRNSVGSSCASPLASHCSAVPTDDYWAQSLQTLIQIHLKHEKLQHERDAAAAAAAADSATSVAAASAAASSLPSQLGCGCVAWRKLPPTFH